MDKAPDPQLHYIAFDDFQASMERLCALVGQGDWIPDFVIGIGRGGLVPAVFMSHRLDVPMLSIDHSSRLPGFADELLAKVAVKSGEGTRLLFVDDINDSGGTIEYVRKMLTDNGCVAENLRFAVMIDNEESKARVDFSTDRIDRKTDKRWFVFPWEAMGTHHAIVEEARSVPERLA